MPTAVTNYPNSFYKFYYDCDVYNKCLPRLNSAVPTLNNMAKITLDIIKPTNIGHNYEYLRIPFPCDLWLCGGTIPDEDFYDMITVKFQNMFTTETWLQNYLGNFVNDSCYFGAESIYDFFYQYGIDISYGFNNQYGCLCYLIFELDWNSDYTVLNSFEVIGKSNVKMQWFANGANCNVLMFKYHPNQDYGFGDNSVDYTFYIAGRCWKPEIKSKGESYQKSNGEVQILSSNINEYWKLSVDMTDYYLQKAIHVALLTNGCKVYSNTMGDFSNNLVFDEYYGYELNCLLNDGEFNYNYTDKCFSSLRANATLINTELQGSMSYGC